MLNKKKKAKKKKRSSLKISKLANICSKNNINNGDSENSAHNTSKSSNFDNVVTTSCVVIIDLETKQQVGCIDVLKRYKDYLIETKFNQMQKNDSVISIMPVSKNKIIGQVDEQFKKNKQLKCQTMQWTQDGEKLIVGLTNGHVLIFAIDCLHDFTPKMDRIDQVEDTAAEWVVTNDDWE